MRVFRIMALAALIAIASASAFLLICGMMADKIMARFDRPGEPEIQAERETTFGIGSTGSIAYCTSPGSLQGMEAADSNVAFGYGALQQTPTTFNTSTTTFTCLY